jgi:hypothetical protein
MIIRMFRALGSLFDPEWKYRIRYEQKYNRWIVETNEGGAHNHWIAICETVTEGIAAGEQVPVKHVSYQDAIEYVEQRGLHHAYKEERYLKGPRPANIHRPNPPDGGGATVKQLPAGVARG